MEMKKSIIKLYNEYVSKNTIETKEYSKCKKELSDELDIIMGNLSNDEKASVERICECLFKMCKEQETNAFVEGYTLGTTITTEAIYRGLK